MQRMSRNREKTTSCNKPSSDKRKFRSQEVW